MSKKIKWGIIGLGHIANKFASDLKLSKSAQLYGVASRDLTKAKDFSVTYDAAKYYGSYKALAEDPEIDAVYIATPHVLHFENTMLCLKNGKAVLCEKPMGMNASEVKRMIEEAKSRNLFLMEGVWTRFIPAIEELLEMLRKKTIGDILFVRADFGFKAELDFERRIYSKKLGGGSLLDIGIYPIYLSLITLGIPTDIKVLARLAETGIDSYCSMLFDYENGTKAILESTIEAKTPTEAYIYGSKGSLKLHSRFFHTKNITLSQQEEDRVLEYDYDGNGYIFEIQEVNNCLLKGETESSKVPLKTSLELITLIDRVRAEIGLKYDENDRGTYNR